LRVDREGVGAFQSIRVAGSGVPREAVQVGVRKMRLTVELPREAIRF
jgi:hypothetical protein